MKYSLLLVVILLAACSSENTIEIGFVGPLSGPVSFYGESQLAGIEIALREINKEGIHGKELKIIFEDSQCKPELSASAVQKLINFDDVKIILGDTCSSAMLASAPIAETNEVIMLTSIAGSDLIKDSGDYIFRNFIPNRYFGRKAPNIMKNYFDAESIAILYINNAAGTSLMESLVENFDGKILFNEPYKEEEGDFSTLLTKVKDSNSDLLVIISYYPDGARILRQAKELDLQMNIFAPTDAVDTPELIELTGKAAEGLVLLSAAIGGSDEYNLFKERFVNEHGEEPPVYSDFAYDSLMIVANAMRSCEDPRNSDCIKEQLYATDYRGASNHIKFDKDGELLNPRIGLKRVENGEIVYLGEVN